jgi:hypothetical protein
MSKVIADTLQLGSSGTATQNLVVRTNKDGTFTLARGNAGATTQDLLTISASGDIAFPAMAGGIAYTPTVTPTSGAFTTLGAVSARYKQVGKLLYLSVSVAITTNGTAAGGVNISLPPGFAAGSIHQMLSGRENAVTGSMLQGIVTATTSTVVVFNYNNSYPGGNGTVLVLGGVIEVA